MQMRSRQGLRRRGLVAASSLARRDALAARVNASLTLAPASTPALRIGRETPSTLAARRPTNGFGSEKSHALAR
jgi:hypothetical protein